MVKVLMVCLGNICRSPLAEGIMRQRAAEKGIACEVDSAGTGNWHIGEPPHPSSQKVARLNKVDISAQRARQFCAKDMQYYDRIYFMDEQNLKDARQIAGKSWNPNRAALLLDALPNCTSKNVPDPYFGGWSDYVEVYKLIDDAVCHLLENDAAFETR
ncbi:MAG: low molecular weight phosphotyrosine protein phosphatase [Chitinophagaceae bacterium]|nr:low molecular weight phosphotyrosine protein phosphatase [Chitinophagaceae bacterium]